MRSREGVNILVAQSRPMAFPTYIKIVRSVDVIFVCNEIFELLSESELEWNTQCELLTNVIVVAAHSKIPGYRLSELHPSNNRVISSKRPSMRTIGLHMSQGGKLSARKISWKYRGHGVSLTNPPRGWTYFAASHH